MLTTLLRDFTLPSQQLVRQSVHHNKNLPHGPWICGLSLTQNNAGQQWLSGHWCGVARGYTQGSLHGSQKGFRCEVILHLFLHWLVLAKGSFTQGPHLPFGMVSKSWVSLFPVFFSLWQGLLVAAHVVTDTCVRLRLARGPTLLIRHISLTHLLLMSLKTKLIH